MSEQKYQQIVEALMEYVRQFLKHIGRQDIDVIQVNTPVEWYASNNVKFDVWDIVLNQYEMSENFKTLMDKIAELNLKTNRLAVQIVPDQGSVFHIIVGNKTYNGKLTNPNKFKAFHFQGA